MPNKQKQKLKICYIPYFGNETNNKAFSPQFDLRWTNVLKKKLEKEGHSIATYDINTIEESDFIISFDNVYYQNTRHFMKILKAKKLGKTVHIDYEPPSADCKIHNNKGLKKLSRIFRVITYNDDVIDSNMRIKGVIGDYLEEEQKFNNDFTNRKLLCVLANYRAELLLFKPHPHELYTKRKEAVDFFQENYPEDFDLYGNFWPKESSKSLIGPVSRKEKMNVLNKYKFVISYDSITNQRGYISEKIFDVFKAKSIPIYWGADNVQDYIPQECFIDKRDFKTYEDLYNYLNSMTEEEYNKRINAIEKYLHSSKYHKYFSSEASAEVIYNEIMKPPVKINYFRAYLILLGFEMKRRLSYKYNIPNYYVDLDKYNEFTLIEPVKTNDIWHIKFEILVSKRHDLEFFVKTKKNKTPIKLKTKISKSQDQFDALKYEFVLSYDDLFLANITKFYVKKKNELKLNKLKFSSTSILNTLHYDEYARFKSTSNIIKLKKTPKAYLTYLKRIIGVLNGRK